MPRQAINVTEGTPDQSPLGFVANSVTVNNITQSWAYIAAAQTFIPPYQYGVVIPLPGSDVSDVRWQTPTSLPVGPTGTGTLSATYTTDALAPSNGVSVFSQQTTVVLGTIATGTPTVFVLPGGTQALLLVSTGGQPFGGSVVGIQSGADYFSGNGTAVQGLIVPVSAITDFSVRVTYTALGSCVVIALFTSQPEPIVSVGVTPGGGAVFNENLTEVNGVPVIGAAGTLGVDIRDVGGSSSGALNVNIADLNGSASVVGQEPMAASFPVVIASNQSAVPENITQVASTATTTWSPAGVLPVGGFQNYTGSAGGKSSYLEVLQRPTFLVVPFTATFVAGTGQQVIAAPGAGNSLVIRRIVITLDGVPLSAGFIKIGTASGSQSLGGFYAGTVATGFTCYPPPFDYGDFLVGDNLPLFVTPAVINTLGVTVMYSIVTTNNWPVG